MNSNLGLEAFRSPSDSKSSEGFIHKQNLTDKEQLHDL